VFFGPWSKLYKEWDLTYRIIGEFFVQFPWTKNSYCKLGISPIILYPHNFLLFDLVLRLISHAQTWLFMSALKILLVSYRSGPTPHSYRWFHKVFIAIWTLSIRNMKLIKNFVVHPLFNCRLALFSHHRKELVL
jgi:hypothetical protein